MDESARTEARNYLSAAGFFVLATAFLLTILTDAGSSVVVEMNCTLQLVLGIGLLIVSTLLIILRKRDMIAILFFMMGLYQLFLAFTSSTGLWSTIMVGFMLLTALVTLTSKDKQKWLLFVIPLIWFLYLLIKACIGENTVILYVFYGILAVISLYYSFVCASERVILPGQKIFTADEQTDFKASGSVLGYMLFAFNIAAWAVFNFARGSAAFPYDTLATLNLLCGSLMLYVAVLLMVVGKMRFTPVMFFLLGITIIFGVFASSNMIIAIGILFLIIGLFTILRKESRILPGLMILISSIFFFVLGGTGYGNPWIVLGIIESIVTVIAVYLSFAVYSQRNLPKF